MIEIKNELSVEEYNNLRKSTGWDEKEISIVENAIKSSVIVKKAVKDNEVVGMARVVGDGIYYLIVDVVVNPNYQGLGIGKKLVEDIVKDIEERTKVGQTCSINLMSMGGKEAFYEKCGFTKVPFGHTGFGMIRRIKK